MKKEKIIVGLSIPVIYITTVILCYAIDSWIVEEMGVNIHLSVFAALFLGIIIAFLFFERFMIGTDNNESITKE